MRFHNLICVVIVGATACSGGVEIDDFQSRLADAFCKNAVACQQAPSEAACKASLQLENRLFETLVAKVKAKRIGYDADRAGDCVDDLASASCAFEGLRQPDNACAETFAGTVAPGGACTIFFECMDQGTCEVTDPSCDPDTACCAGTCQPVPAKVALGADCTNAPCEDNAYCASTTNRCTTPVTAAGAACDALDACANPMICDIFATAPTCVVPAARGATCDPMAFLACADSRDYCDETTRKCTANVAVGGACDGPNGAECVGYARCTNMMCEPLALAGAACTAGTDTSCLGDLECPSGTCVLAGPEAACPRTAEPTGALPTDAIETVQMSTTRMSAKPTLQPDSRSGSAITRALLGTGHAQTRL